MKILELYLKAFGPFTDHVLDLSGGQYGLHLVYGPNEAGKSTTLRALRAFFYGIETRSSDNFVHPHPKMRIGAKLQTADGETLELIRRKGNRNTLRDASDDKAVNESVLSSPLGGVDEATFTQRYGLGYDDLVRGGREIVAGGGDLGQSLFAAASGAANLKAVQAELSGEAEELFLPSARIRKINKSVAEYNELQSQIKHLLLPTATWREHDKALREATEQRESIRQQVSLQATRLQELQRRRDAVPLAAKRAQLQAGLEPVADAPLLSDDFPENRRKAVTALDVAQRSLKTHQVSLDELTQELEGLSTPTDILQHRQTVTHLQQRLGSHLKAMEDRRLRKAEQKTALAAATSALKDLGRTDLAIDEADQLRIKPDERVRIQNLGNEKSKLVERVGNAQEKIDDFREQLETVASELEACPPIQNTAALTQALSAARDAGPLDKRLDELHSQQTASEDEIARKLARLHGYSGDLETLEQLALPNEETIDRFEQSIADAQQPFVTLRDKLAGLEEESRQLEEQLTALHQGHEVPTESDLLDARRLREAGWKLIQRQISGETVSAAQMEDFAREFSADDDLTEAFSQAVTQADGIADRLRREASQVAERAQLRGRHDALTKRIEDLNSQMVQARSDCEVEQQRWESLWSALNITSQSPREMRAWLRQAHELCEASRSQRMRQQEIEQCEQQRFACVRSIASALNGVGEEIQSADNVLQAIRLADETVTSIDEQNRRRDQLQLDHQRLTRELQRAESLAKGAADELAQWAKQWSDAIAPLRLRDGAEPAEANAAIEATKHLLEHLEEASSLEQRIAGIDRDATQFEQDVKELCNQVAPSLTERSVQRAVEGLTELVDNAQQVRTRQAELKKQRNTAQTQCREARSDLQRAEAQLAALCVEAGCQDWKELPAAEENSRRHASLERDLRQLNDRLIELAAGQPIEDFVQSLSEYKSQDIAQELTGLENEINDLREKESALGEEIGAQRKQLDQWNGGAQAAEARQRAEQVLANIRADAEQYARLHLAGVVLQRAVERYRQRHQGPVLQRASDLFAMLTLGEFEALRADLDDFGSPVLVGVRRGGEVVHVNGMSDGTCDQLYLALRLASLETDLAGREPLPLIVDDILIKFDDDRAVAALKALAATSEKTQVILFTHHEHVVELAKDALDDDVLFTHQLNRRRIPAEAT